MAIMGNSIFVILVLKLTSWVLCVPPEYCLHALNQSDCSLKPTPVFAYYKPGSRCELRWWKGCPTVNKFMDEYECSFICIGRLSMGVSNEDNNGLIGFETPKYCLEKLNKDRCDTKFELVYTYIPEKRRCQWNIWYQCHTLNKFPDDASCYSACTGKQYIENGNNDDIHHWIEILEELNKDIIINIIQIIIEISKENVPLIGPTNSPEDNKDYSTTKKENREQSTFKTTANNFSTTKKTLSTKDDDNTKYTTNRIKTSPYTDYDKTTTKLAPTHQVITTDNHKSTDHTIITTETPGNSITTETIVTTPVNYDDDNIDIDKITQTTSDDSKGTVDDIIIPGQGE